MLVLILLYLLDNGSGIPWETTVNLQAFRLPVPVSKVAPVAKGSPSKSCRCRPLEAKHTKIVVHAEFTFTLGEMKGLEQKSGVI